VWNSGPSVTSRDVRRGPHWGGYLPSGTEGRLVQESVMKAMKSLLVKLVRDEQGGEVLEYALIAGLIVVAAIAAITSVGSKVLARWTSLNASV
jgi:pilus assembly protein Flp/PilA